MCLVPLTPCEWVQPGSRPGTPRPRRRTEETVPEDDLAIDRVRLSGISAIGHHGVLEHERREGQTFVADVVLHVDTRPAAEQDRLDLTVDYGVLAQEVVDVLIGSPADLLETVAERVAAVALEHEIVQAVDVVLALGSNVGASQDTLRDAITALAAVDGLQVGAIAPLARSAPVGGPDQPDYLNTVVLGRTVLSPRALLRACQAIETQCGRLREERWGPRTLDIDIVLHGSTVGVVDDLELPHPRAHGTRTNARSWARGCGKDWWRVEMNVAGYGGTQNRQTETVLLPVGDRQEALLVLWLVIPDLGTADPQGLLDAALSGSGEGHGFVTDPRRARWLNPWTWRRNGVAMTDRAVLLRGRSSPH